MFRLLIQNINTIITAVINNLCSQQYSKNTDTNNLKKMLNIGSDNQSVPLTYWKRHLKQFTGIS